MDSNSEKTSRKPKAKFGKNIQTNECVRSFKLQRHFPSTVTELKKNGLDKHPGNSPGTMPVKAVKDIITALPLSDNMKFIPSKEVKSLEVHNLKKLKLKSVNGKELVELTMPNKIQKGLIERKGTKRILPKILTRPSIIQKSNKSIKLPEPVVDELSGQKSKITNIAKIISDSSFEEHGEKSEESGLSKATVQIINNEKVLSFNTVPNSGKPIIIQTTSSDTLKTLVAPNIISTTQSKQSQIVTMKSIPGYHKVLMVKKSTNQLISPVPEQFKQISLVRKNVVINQATKTDNEKVIIQKPISNPSEKKRDSSSLDQPDNIECKRLCQDKETQDMRTVEDSDKTDVNEKLGESSLVKNVSSPSVTAVSPKKDIMVIVPHDAERELAKISSSLNEDFSLDDNELLFFDEKDLLEADNFIQDDELSSTRKSVESPTQEDTEESFDQDVQKSKPDRLLDKFSILEKAVMSVQDEGLRAKALKALQDCGIKSKKKIPTKRPLPSKIIHESAVQTNVFSLLKEGEFLEADEEHENLIKIKSSRKNPKQPNISFDHMTRNETYKDPIEYRKELDNMLVKFCPNQQNVFEVKSAFQQSSKIKAKHMLKQLLNDFEAAKKYDGDGYLGIHRAVIDDDLQNVQKHIIVLKAAKQDIDVCTEDGQSSLELAIDLEVNTQIIKKLLENGARPVTSKTAHDSALIIAAKKSSRILPFLLNSIRPEDRKLINSRDSEGLAAIHYCAQHGNLEGISELIRHKADVNLQDDRSGRTALFYAVDTKSNVPQETYYDIAQKLVDNGAYSNIPTFSKHSVLTLIDDVKSHSLKIALNRAVR